MEAMRQFILAFQGPVWHVNAEIVPESLPRLWYEFIGLEGPLTEYPTKASTELLTDGETGDAAEARKVFTRFLPRAFRRPVSPEEIESLVRVVQNAQEQRGKFFADAPWLGHRAGLITPEWAHATSAEPPTRSCRSS